MTSFGIVGCTVVGNEEAVRNPCLHKELQQGYQVSEALEVKKSELQTQLEIVSTNRWGKNVTFTDIIAAGGTQFLLHWLNRVCFDC